MNLDLLADAKGKTIAGLVCLVALLAVGIGGYLWGNHRGYAEAKAKGDAEVSGLKAEHAAAVSESLAKALKRNEELTAQGNRIAADLITTRTALASTRAALNQRIPDVAATVSADCAFGADFIGLCNALAGLGPADLPQAADTGGAAGAAAAGAAADSGVRQGASVAAASPADLLAWLRDYGAQCQDYKALAGKRLELLEEWAK